VLLPLSLSHCNLYYAKFYSDPEKCFLHAQRVKPYDVIIVPGYPFIPGVHNPILEQRIAWAVYLYKHGYTDHIIFSGGAVHSPYIEAEVMRLYAIQAGVKPEDIKVEAKAEHTTENIYYSFLMAEKNGFKKKAFASQPNQTSSMIHFSKKNKLPVDMLPIVTDSLLKYPIAFDTLDVSKAIVADFIPLRKKRGLIGSFRGTLGHTVKAEIRKAKRLKRNNKQVQTL